MRGVIFDLDMTLIDTSCLENARKRHSWNDAYRLIPLTHMYDGIAQVLEFLCSESIKMGIVSSSPHAYIERLVDYYHMPTSVIVGYHDAHPNKPHPTPMLKALEWMKEDASDVVSFGDRACDIAASNAAGIKGVGCLWGTQEKDLLMASGCYRFIEKPLDIIPILQAESSKKR